MSRIVLSTIGVRGDLNPFVAIARGLRARGHDLVFAVEPALQAAVAEEGFEARHLSGDVFGSLAPHLGSIIGGSNALTSVRPIVREWLASGLADKVRDLTAACDGADLLIARTGNLAAAPAADRLGLPWVQVTMSALTLPSAEADPGVLPLPMRAAPRVLNRAGWAAVELVTGRLADPPVNEVRQGLGLRPVRNVMGRGGHSRHMTVLAVSPAVSPPRPDWPDYVRTTGYCFWDVPTGWREPHELTAFLQEPGPVVAISFGSISPYVGYALAPLYETAVEAVLAAGARALVVGGSPARREHMMALSFAPFSEVYPRCTAAIHHGGPYTVGEALRAGIPSLAVPWGIDQFFTSAELTRTGAGRKRSGRRFSRARAQQDVRAILEHTAYRERAKAMAGRIALEDGVGSFCAAVEEVLGRRGVPAA